MGGATRDHTGRREVVAVKVYNAVLAITRGAALSGAVGCAARLGRATVNNTTADVVAGIWIGAVVLGGRHTGCALIVSLAAGLEGATRDRTTADVVAGLWMGAVVPVGRHTGCAGIVCKAACLDRARIRKSAAEVVPVVRSVAAAPITAASGPSVVVTICMVVAHTKPIICELALSLVWWKITYRRLVQGGRCI